MLVLLTGRTTPATRRWQRLGYSAPSRCIYHSLPMSQHCLTLVAELVARQDVCISLGGRVHWRLQRARSRAVTGLILHERNNFSVLLLVLQHVSLSGHVKGVDPGLKVSGWLQASHVQFQLLILSHSLDLDLELSRITLDIKSGEEFGVVGCIGAEKTTCEWLVSSHFFPLYNSSETPWRLIR